MDDRILLGLVVGGVIGVVGLLYTYSKEQIQNFLIKRNENQRRKEKQEIENQPINRNLKSIENLEDLRDSGLLTESEYQEKVEKLRDKIQLEQVKNSDEYQKLKDLFDKGILSNDEFESKLKILQDKLQLNSNSFVFENKNFRVVDGFSEGIGLAIDSDLDYGFVDENGEILIDFIFDHAENFKNGVSKVRYKGEFKMIDKKGNFI